MSGHPERSSIVSTLEELVRRVGHLGEAAQANHDEVLAHELFAVERALTAARRRLERLDKG
jgi:hypothetical protein